MKHLLKSCKMSAKNYFENKIDDIGKEGSLSTIMKVISKQE